MAAAAGALLASLLGSYATSAGVNAIQKAAGRKDQQNKNMMGIPLPQFEKGGTVTKTGAILAHRGELVIRSADATRVKAAMKKAGIPIPKGGGKPGKAIKNLANQAKKKMPRR